MTTSQPVPEEIVRRVEEYVAHERRDAVKFVNRTPLDESGIYSLHMLAETIYAAGWDAGVRVGDHRQRQRIERDREDREATP